MSQKTNPISLRLQNSNKHFESCWYSDFFYNQVLGDEIKLGIYIKGLLYQAGRSKTLPSIQSQYKRYSTLLFLLDQRAERHKREFSLKLSREPVEHVVLPKIKFLPNKSKTSISVWDGSLLSKAQGVLREKKLSQKERYKSLIEEGTKRKRSGLTHKGIQNYVYKYASKGSSLEALSLSGVKPRKVLSKKKADLFNTIINPGIKHNSFARVANYNKGSNDFSINSKGFLSFLFISFALLKAIPCIQELPLKGIALMSFREQSSSKVDIQVDSVLHNATLAENAVFIKNRLLKGLTNTILSLQEAGRENLFRRLILDHNSQSSQNRLSFRVVKSLEKQFSAKQSFATTNILSIVDDRSSIRYTTSRSINLLEKTILKKNTTRVLQQKWKTKSLGLARHTELFLNTYSGTFGFHTVYPIRAISPFQSAAFLLESVAYLLQRKSSFRQIKDDIFRELDQYELVKGARLSCAGRLGGRSKKAQKAKTQSAQWGETSLTVLSSRLAFASKGVSTTYGKVGVKVWLCYK